MNFKVYIALTIFFYVNISCTSLTIEEKGGLTASWQENCVAFAAELCELHWTPIRPMPSSLKGFISDGTEDENVVAGRYYYLPNVENEGIPYSCAGEHGRNIGSDVRVETFMTALKNPNSVVYTIDTRDVAPSGITSCYYGDNCSSFTNLLQNIPVLCFGRNCFFGGNRLVDTLQNIESAQVGDMVYMQREVKDQGHAILIVGITKENGEIVSIKTVEENPRDDAVVVNYTKQSFNELIFKGGRGYVSAGIYRNDDIQNLIEYEAFNENDYLYSEEIGLNLGNNTNYDKSDSIKIEVTVFNGASFDLIKNGYRLETYLPTDGVPGYGNTKIVTIDKSKLDCGMYEVRPHSGVSQFFCLANSGSISALRQNDGSIIVSSHGQSSNVNPYGVIFFSDSKYKTTRGMYKMEGNEVTVPSDYMTSIDTFKDIAFAMVVYRNGFGNIYSKKVQITNMN